MPFVIVLRVQLIFAIQQLAFHQGFGIASGGRTNFVCRDVTQPSDSILYSSYKREAHPDTTGKC